MFANTIKKREQNSNVKLALKIIQSQFEAFTKKHYDKLMKSLDINEEQLKKALDIILHFKPKIWEARYYFRQSSNHRCDFTVENNNGALKFIKWEKVYSRRISDSFKEMLTSYGKGAMKIKNKKKP